MAKISLCVPCYNEEKNIDFVYKELTRVMHTLPQYTYEIIFADNASTDHTQALLRRLAGQDPRVKVIFNTRNFGPSRSGKNCCFNASGDVIISVASDLQNPVDMIPEFLKYWEEGYPVVMGQKTQSRESGLKYACRKLYYKIIGAFSEIPQIPQITGFGAIDAQVYQEVYRMQEPQMSIRHILAELGYDIKLVPYTQEARKHGKSSYNLWRNLDFAVTSLINTSRFPIRFLTIAGTIGTPVCLLLNLVCLLAHVLFAGSVGSLISMLLFILLLFFIQLFFMGILGEYLSAVYDHVLVRETVIEKERINFTDEPTIKDKCHETV